MNERKGLSSLAEVELSASARAWLDRLAADASGDAVWRARKRAEIRDLLALAELAPAGRLRVEDLDSRQALRAMVLVDVPVAVRDAGDEVRTERRALLGLQYPREALSRSLPGYAFLQILSPDRVFHANVATRPAQLLCLGATLPPGVRVSELIVMAYGALSMQSVMLDASDPAGVMNPAAAEWWLAHRDRLPLSATPFLVPETVATGGGGV